jgi:hypothetical protein
MKPYYELYCEHLPLIQQQTLAWLQQHYNLTDQSSLQTDLWLKIDTKSFLKSSPALLSWFRSLKLLCKETAVTVINDMSGATLHIDELPVVAKINIPILNYHNVINQWYQVPKHLLETVNPIKNQFGSDFYILSNIDLGQCTLLDSIELTQPIVFNSQIPHNVVCLTGAKFPRVVLTCMFLNEPVEYLVNKNN